LYFPELWAPLETSKGASDLNREGAGEKKAKKSGIIITQYQQSLSSLGRRDDVIWGETWGRDTGRLSRRQEDCGERGGKKGHGLSRKRVETLLRRMRSGHRVKNEAPFVQYYESKLWGMRKSTVGEGYLREKVKDRIKGGERRTYGPEKRSSPFRGPKRGTHLAEFA